jgi:prevent-host-death family protein
MSEQVNIHEAKTHFSRLVERAAAGEEIVIAKAGEPRARLVPLERPSGRRRGYGSMRGKIWLADDWDSDETNEAIAHMFFGDGEAEDPDAVDVDADGETSGA